MEHHIPSEKMSEVVAALMRGEMLTAIKLYRDAANCDLAQAKHDVETLQTALKMASMLGDNSGKISTATTTVTTGTTTRVTNFSVSVNGVKLPDDIAAHVQAALQSGNKIEAIKVYRMATNIGLREAKDAIESIGDAVSHQHHEFHHDQEMTQPTSFHSGERTRGMGLWIYFFVFVMIACAVWWFVSR